MQTSLMSLSYIVEKEMGWQVLWQANDGAQAIQACAEQLPDMILMDLLMPVMDGVAATGEIMRNNPCPIVIVTAGVDKNAVEVFEALSEGALDAIEMPAMNKQAIDTFIHKLQCVALLVEHGQQESAPELT